MNVTGQRVSKVQGGRQISGFFMSMPNLLLLCLAANRPRAGQRRASPKMSIAADDSHDGGGL